ncbi:MAG: branched-chain amino acid ABC transporter permease [Desulfovibrionales bacterium]
MDALLVVHQLINGLQLGMMLFLMAAGLTLIFGIMDLINLAHGSLYMVGAYLCAAVYQALGSFPIALCTAMAGSLLVGIIVEVIALRTLYSRSHLDQVVATFGLILFFNELAKIVWGPQAMFLEVPGWLGGTVQLLPGMPYPAYRLAVLVIGILVAVGLYLLITRTRVGMLIRAGATNRAMVGGLGVNVKLLYTLVFGLGALLAGLGGALAGPLYAVEIGMGESILILSLVVIVIGGIGSIRGALLGAILVGVIDTMGRAFLPQILGLVFDPATANGVGFSLASMSVYIIMALILAVKPQGLLPAHG